MAFRDSTRIAKRPVKSSEQFGYNCYFVDGFCPRKSIFLEMFQSLEVAKSCTERQSLNLFEKLISFIRGYGSCEDCGITCHFKVVIIEERRKTNLPRQISSVIQPHKFLETISKKIYYSRHGLEKINQKIKNYPRPIIWSDVGKDRFSGSFFYEAKDLNLESFQKDKTTYDAWQTRLKNAGDSKALWISYDSVWLGHDPIFNATGATEVIEKSELVWRLEEHIRKIEAEYNSGEFYFSLPRGSMGLWIWEKASVREDRYGEYISS